MKNLIYTIAVGDKYLKMFEYWHQSLKRTSNLDNIEVWLFTDEAGKDILEKQNISNVKILLCKKHPYVQPAYNNVKFEIHQHLHDQVFDKIIYCDADILINDDINNIFKNISTDQVYAMFDRACTAKSCNIDIWHFYKVYNQKEQQYLIENNVALHCAGFFGFLANSKKIHTGFLHCLELFNQVPTLNLITEPNAKKRIKVIDQAVFNSLLSSERLLAGKESLIVSFEPHLIKIPPFNNNFNYPVLHFIHPASDSNLSEDKLEAMKCVFKKIFN